MNKKVFRYQYEHHKQSNKTILLITIFLSLVFSSTSLGIKTDVLPKIIGGFLLIYLINLIREDYYGDRYYSSVVDYSTRSDEPHLETWKKIKKELEDKKGLYPLSILIKYSYVGFGKWNAVQMIVGYLAIAFFGVWLLFI